MVEGVGVWYLYEIALWMHEGNILRHVFRNRLKCHLLQSNRYGFRNRLKCHLIQSVNNVIVVTYCNKCHQLSHSIITVNGITLIG